MEFLDEIPAEEQKKNKKHSNGRKRNAKKTAQRDDKVVLEIGYISFQMGDVDFVVEDLKVRNMKEFRNFLQEVLNGDWS